MPDRFRDRPAAVRRDLTQAMAELGATDLERWSQRENLKSNWAERAEVAAQLVPPGVRLLDIGCGSMDIERFLHPTTTYIPADVVRRDDRTIICDLNRREFPDVGADVISLLGVLEYIHDLPRLFAVLRSRNVGIIASYNPVDLGKPDRDRPAQGWFNDLTTAEMAALAADKGLQLIGMVTIDPQIVCEFRPA
jgi:hypothetical protein